MTLTSCLHLLLTYNSIFYRYKLLILFSHCQKSRFIKPGANLTTLFSMDTTQFLGFILCLANFIVNAFFLMLLNQACTTYGPRAPRAIWGPWKLSICPSKNKKMQKNKVCWDWFLAAFHIFRKSPNSVTLNCNLLDSGTTVARKGQLLEDLIQWRSVHELVPEILDVLNLVPEILGICRIDWRWIFIYYKIFINSKIPFKYFGL